MRRVPAVDEADVAGAAVEAAAVEAAAVETAAVEAAVEAAGGKKTQQRQQS